MASRRPPQHRLIISIAGRRATNDIDVHDGHRAKWLEIRCSGSILRVYDQRPLRAMHRAWVSAELQARTTRLPLRSAVLDPPHSFLVSRTDVHPHHEIAVFANIQHSQEPHVAVTQGPVTFVAYDRAAIEEMRLTWRRAIVLGVTLPGALARNSYVYEAMKRWARNNYQHEFTDQAEMDAVIDLSGGLEVPWLRHVNQSYATTLIQLGRSWEAHGRTMTRQITRVHDRELAVELAKATHVE